MADLQAQLNVHSKLMQSIRDELGGVKRALAARDSTLIERKSQLEIKIEATWAMVGELHDLCGAVYRNDRRLEAILAHLGIPDVKIEGDDEEGPL
jgi:hypothetical protein